MFALQPRLSIHSSVARLVIANARPGGGRSHGWAVGRPAVRQDTCSPGRERVFGQRAAVQWQRQYAQHRNHSASGPLDTAANRRGAAGIGTYYGHLRRPLLRAVQTFRCWVRLVDLHGSRRTLASGGTRTSRQGQLWVGLPTAGVWSLAAACSLLAALDLPLVFFFFCWLMPADAGCAQLC